jgi:hypothetical protein
MQYKSTVVIVVWWPEEGTFNSLSHFERGGTRLMRGVQPQRNWSDGLICISSVPTAGSFTLVIKKPWNIEF